MTDHVNIVEVGARDGLQNESRAISLEQRRQLILRLMQTGLQHIEVGACVSPKWVPKMASSAELFASLPSVPEIDLSLLTPNLQGYEAAKAAGCQEVAIFTAASESFTRKNINCSIAESFSKFAPLCEAAKADNIKVRGYVSCVVDCPYEGAIEPAKVIEVTRRLFDLGCYEVSLGETIGSATPNRVQALWQACQTEFDMLHLAGHFHNTYGMAIANIYASLDYGVRTFDASIAGLGGCPYAKGAAGNVATEDLFYLLRGLGLDTGIDVEALMVASRYISTVLKKPPESYFAKAYWRQCESSGDDQGV
ncbi:hydroxymethylglutaryl-CoA lyase [Brackiella oedipodis]|uniref:hydroxymethylglutaryl-CoA lyase n=1 Tax=Brackiella oedipodis TaxID=124225 RepID=UPI00048C761D|nr:hydroxymethylglutaryl-CoA lyase [Brackiella oedipodis]